MIDWKLLLNLPDYLPLLKLPYKAEQVQNGVYRLGEDCGLIVSDVNFADRSVSSAFKPFVASVFWVSSDEALRRVFLLDWTADVPEPDTLPPLELRVDGFRCTYGELRESAAVDSRWLESERFEVVGNRFLCLSLEHPRIRYFFAARHPSPQDPPIAVLWPMSSTLND